MDNLEKSLKNNMMTSGDYLYGEQEYVKTILDLARKNDCKPWDIALKYPTTSFSSCVKNIGKNKNSETICSCWDGLHEEIYYYLHNKGKDMKWDDIEMFVGFLESDEK